MAQLNSKSAFLLSALLAANLYSYSQVAGDEDANMLNKAQQRDQKAMDEARNGWWKNSMKTHDERIQWWRDARFGMFIHWGLYSLPAGEWKGRKVNGYSEHLMRKEQITRAEYLDLAHVFNPVKFNAEEWILTAKKAGMRYFIITAKHHDGFAMFDSNASDFNVVKQTPFKRDPMAELAAAAKKYGMKFGFYYSHAFDWEHPDAPGNDWEYQNPGGDKLLGGANWFDSHPEWLPKAVKYVDEKAIPQIKELINKYHPDILWFDTPHKLPLSENIRILKAIRDTDPNIVVNGRLARSASGNFGDYANTGDRPAELLTVAGDSEAIPTTNESYGYSKHDNSHKSAKFFIQLLANSASRGGNLLMNIGPKGDGTFDQKDKQILDSIGGWLSQNGAAIYGTQKGELPIPAWGVSTQKGKNIYLHVFNWPKDGNLVVGGLKSDVKTAYLLTDKSKRPLTVKRLDAADLNVSLPANVSGSPDVVVVLEVNGKLETDGARVLSPNIPANRFLVFDAEQHGKKLGFGDGKTDRYFVNGWKSKDSYLTWNLKALKSAKYKVVVKYIADEGGSSYEVKVGDFSKQEEVIASKKGAVVTTEIGVSTLGAGPLELSIKPVAIKGSELMKLLEIQLLPVQ
ncbi:MAG: alpha-L-fucosidase [Candidatus Pedobacter colombiensis]|uniref:alpha-L-fucosidase n=1 Tax=Candidatus Pedobacter colombiensis TaxID=3121371 RepID=A0AAJ6B5M0_9SPHI|nr:alpha-L-fucosidase [Pedobacter sp.]WEK17626.1 MAG: alpha-L-fucosidase [Pedobacter sp.]